MKIEINVPDGKSGSWEVSTFEVTEDDAKFHNMRAIFQPGCRTIKAGKYKQLTRNGQIIMSNTPAEIRDHARFIYQAKNSEFILINGLGLGVALTEILKSDQVKSVDIVEISEDVIDLVGPTFKNDKRVTIIKADALKYKDRYVRYNVVWHDIWDNICSDNLPEMTKLHRKWGKKTDWQGSWCKDECKRNRS